MTFDKLSTIHADIHERIQSIDDKIETLQRMKNQLYQELVYKRITRYNYEGKINALNASLLEFDHIKNFFISFRDAQVKEFTRHA